MRYAQIKRLGKQHMGRHMLFWLSSNLLFVCLEVLLSIFALQAGGRLGWYLLPLKDYPDLVNGFHHTVEGAWEIVYRMDALGSVAAISLTTAEILQFLGINALILLLLAPMKLASLERFWLSFQNRTEDPPHLLRWYSNLGLLGKAVAVCFVTDVLMRLFGLVCMLPATVLSFWLQGQIEVLSSGLLSALSLLGIVLLFLGMGVGFYCHSILYPILYCLAARPAYPLGKVFRRGLDSISGCRLRYVKFRLSFIVWLLLRRFGFGELDLFIHPYMSFASFVFLAEASGESLNEQ